MENGLLAIVSHPDDETFGCGGTLALHAAEGHPVSILCLSCSDKERGKEILRAARVLGADESIVFEEDKIAFSNDLISRISNLIISKRPKVVFTHIPYDYHREHRLTFEIVKEAIEWAGHSTLYEDPWTVQRLLLFEVNTLIPTPQVIIDISEFFEKKMEAIHCYSSQLKKFRWDYYQNFNYCKAKLRGIQGDCSYAEAFVKEPLPENGPFYKNRSIRRLI